ncbi:cupin 2 domain-containing protein [Purpureocillium lavendulum]|uniref:Cupin 2 domain-containing protein n=1 Tax=Purpureocillium lavendulum TaxID=1247861 RepID=A0AB34FUE7_9HYPO|nr:cupin 2 domain-containing protein [Purpureocillium lavendulum]
MRAISLLLSFAILGSAAIVPRDATDGVYVVTMDAAGNEIHSRVSDPITAREEGLSLDTETDAREARSLLRREKSVDCNCYHDLDPKDTNAAVKDLKYQVGSFKFFSYKSVYSIRGSVIAFACNMHSESYTSAQLIPQMLEAVTQACGRYVVGAATTDETPGKHEAWVGYMENIDGVDFCYQRTTWTDSSCP